MAKIDDLLSEMTLAEKLGQITMTAAAYAVTGPVVAGDATQAIRSGEIGNLLNIYGAERVHDVQRLAVEETRLGVPLLIGLDVIHGHRTMFPVPLAEAGAFDPQLWEATARESAKEAAADGVNVVFAPMLDVSRDPRWGRSVEGPGEDVFVACRIAEAKVRGFQGEGLDHADAVAATLKHYCGYAPVLAGREYASVDISERTLREVHLPPFAAGVAAGAALVMPAFTDLAGIPMTANGALLKDELRGRLGFKGVVVSDYNSVAELMRHGVAADLVEAAALALRAGVDVDMMADAYRRGLPAALERGLVEMHEIDASVRRVLELKQALGLFDDPYRRGRSKETQRGIASRRALARRAAAASLVLLKNDRDLFPLDASGGRVAAIGPLADAGGDMRGPWWAAATEEGQVTPLAGLRAAAQGGEVVYARGAEVEGADRSGFAEAIACAQGAKLVVLCLGERAEMSGEASSRAHPGLPGVQQDLADAVLDAAAKTGTPVAVVLFCGRPLIVPQLIARAQAVFCAWWLGSEAGSALADAIYGAVSPGGRTPVSWARAVGQIPIFYGERPSGRPDNPEDRFTSKYLDVPNAPLFPFGAGLTYGRVVLSNLRVTPAQPRVGDSIEVLIDAANEGAHAAQETLFVFVRDRVASVARPLLELKAFQVCALAPGERRQARFVLKGEDMRFLGRDLLPVFEAGEVEILVGSCADRARLTSRTIALALS